MTETSPYPVPEKPPPLLSPPPTPLPLPPLLQTKISIDSCRKLNVKRVSFLQKNSQTYSQQFGKLPNKSHQIITFPSARRTTAKTALVLNLNRNSYRLNTWLELR